MPSSALCQLALVEYFWLDPRPADLGIATAMECQSNQKVKAPASLPPAIIMSVLRNQDLSPTPLCARGSFKRTRHVQLNASLGREAEVAKNVGLRRECEGCSSAGWLPLPSSPRILPLLFIKSPPQLRSSLLPVELGLGQDPTSTLRLQSRLLDFSVSFIQGPPYPSPASLRPRSGEGPVAPRGLIHMQETVRSSDRQQHTKTVPPQATPCQPRFARRPGGLDGFPLLLVHLSALRDGLHHPMTSGRRQAPLDPEL